MTKQELNRDIKRLAHEFYRLSFEDSREYYEYAKNEGKSEFVRLLNSDKEFKYMSHKSILQMYRINLRFKYIPLDSFGLNLPFLIE